MFMFSSSEVCLDRFIKTISSTIFFFSRKSFISCLNCTPNDLLPQLPHLQAGLVRTSEIICCVQVDHVQTASLSLSAGEIPDPGSQLQTSYSEADGEQTNGSIISAATD